MQNDIKKALEVLQNGGVILYPNDTIWGLGCDATNPNAVKKIYDIKKREDNKSMIVLVDQVGRLFSYIDDVPEVALDVIELTEKPLTVIFDGAKNLADNVINKEDKSIGIRISQDDFCQKLIQRFKKPIVSTSANISGEESPYTFSEINEYIKNQVDYIVKHRQDDTKKVAPSGIIKIGQGGTIKIIRE